MLNLWVRFHLPTPGSSLAGTWRRESQPPNRNPFMIDNEGCHYIKKLNAVSMSAVLPLKSGRRDGDFNLNFLSKLAKLTCRCFLRAEIYVFAAFRFDENPESFTVAGVG